MRPQVLSAEEDRERNELLLMRAEDTRTRDLRLARNRAAERQRRADRRAAEEQAHTA